MYRIPKIFSLFLCCKQNKLPADIAKEGGLTAVVAAIKIRQEVVNSLKLCSLIICCNLC
jgi:hypothetical protein